MSYYNAVYANDELSHRAKAVYVYLRDRANGEGFCWPSVKTIGRELKLSRRTVQRALLDLERAGMVQRKLRCRESNGSYTSNLYLVQGLDGQ